MNYFIIWIEGLCWKTGEKILSIKNGTNTYTTYMTEALRVKRSDIEQMRKILEHRGIASNFITFIPTTYAPTGTICNPKNN